MLMQFMPSGAVHFTRSPRLLALLPDDEKRITRMTEIKFSQSRQLHFIEFASGSLAGCVLVRYHHRCVLSSKIAGLWQVFRHQHAPAHAATAVYIGEDPRIFFSTYEDAVAVEIEFVEMLRSVYGETME